ncbi:hypothetical protein HHK36_027745 [Tetracentron sinense]|uniref:P-type Cu(+) transporter n=1 Tax=Tetracentron sinense TaxID=13715 RepID=A0A835D3U0_TETSI|nr:hypothetical protein HHK36_027745 [Tetracentron sinense]
MITGEARPVAKRKGDTVIGGTVNENGVLHVQATRVGSESALSQIVRLVESAQMAKAPVQKFADRISKYFVPLVIILSFSTWLTWFLAGKFNGYPKSWIPSSMDSFQLALQFGISVMVIACPCALGLATPTAVMVGTGVGASQGVLIKGGPSFESAHKVNCIVFDKTGTLTIGKPIVVNTRLLKNMALRNFYELVAATEVNSEHPLAKAIVEYAKKFREDEEIHVWPEARDFVSITGHGVRATVQNKEIIVGNKSLMLDSNIPIPIDAEEILVETEGMAQTGILVSIDGEVHYGDSDNWGTANSIAEEVGIKTVIAEAKPEQKAEEVKDLQASGLIVAMVGDGINDSPALVAADVGMAIGAGTDIAIEAADIVLMKSNLEDVITAIDLSRKTFSRIRLNYIWALGYNLLGIPIAAGALFPSTGFRLPPWIAGAAMASSSEETIRVTIEDVGFQATLIEDEINERSTQICRIRTIGMTRTSCSRTVESALQVIHGVQKAQVALTTEEAEIRYDPKILSHNKLIEAIEDTGFEAILISMGEDRSKIQLKVDGIRTDHSMRMIKNSLIALPRVQDIDIDPTLFKFSLSYKPDETGLRNFIKVIESTGSGCFKAMIFPEGGGRDTHRKEEIRQYYKSFLWSLVFTIPVFLTSMVFMYIPGIKHGLDAKVVNMLSIGELLKWILSTPVQFIIGRRFYTGSYKALRHGSTNMDVLIALGTNAAYFYSVYLVLRAATSHDLRPEISLRPAQCSFHLFYLGNIWSHVNESMITGEARPVAKRKGDTVIGGTVNENGVLHVQATRIGSESALSQIVRLVESVQRAKAPVQKFADRISKYFVPLFLAGKFNGYPKSWIPSSMDSFQLALQFGISVMVIACPCALGLATPTAVMVGTGVGASQGVLIKGGQALESAHKVNCIVFDKTGTLTIGKPIVVNTRLLKNMVLRNFYELVTATEVNSEHPLAKAIVEYAKTFREDEVIHVWPEARDFVSITGHGVRATVQNKEIIVGNKSLMLDSNIPIPIDAEEILVETEGMAQTGILVSIDGEVVGVLAISDPLKPGAQDVISILKSMNVRCIMVTGDNKDTANSIANEVGIETVFAEA